MTNLLCVRFLHRHGFWFWFLVFFCLIFIDHPFFCLAFFPLPVGYEKLENSGKETGVDYRGNYLCFALVFFHIYFGSRRKGYLLLPAAVLCDCLYWHSGFGGFSFFGAPSLNQLEPLVMF